MLNEDSIKQFKQLYRQEYGVNLPNKKAYELASNLVNLYRAVYLTSSPKNINQEYEKKPQFTQN